MHYNLTLPEKLSGGAPERGLSVRMNFVLLGAILLLGIAIRYYQLGYFSIWYDEGFTINYAYNFAWSLRFLSVDLSSDPPLLPAMTHFWYRLALSQGLTPGSESFDAFIRLLPFAFSVALLPLVYVLTRMLVADARVALAATLICALSPYHLFYAQELKPYSLYAMLVVAAAILHLQALRSDKTWIWLCYGLLLTLSLYSHFIAAWNILLFNAHVIFVQIQEKKIRWGWVYSQVAAFLLCLPVIVMAARISGIYENATTIYALSPDLKQPFISFKTFFAGYSAAVGFYHAIFLLALALLGVGLFYMRKRPVHLGFYLFYGALPIVGNVVFWQLRTLPIYEHRLFIVCSVYVFIVVAYAVFQLPRKAQYAVLAAYIILTPIFLFDYYRQNFHPLETHRMGVRQKVDSRSVAAYLREAASEENAVILHAAHFTFYPMRHYLWGTDFAQHNVYHDEGELHGTLGSYPHRPLWESYQALPVYLGEATAGHNEIWFVQSWWEPHETPEHVARMLDWLEAEFRVVDSHEFYGITLHQYRRPSVEGMAY